MTDLIPTIAISAAALVYCFQRFGWIPMSTTTAHFKQRTEDAEAALEKLEERNRRLEQERTNEPVLHIVATVLERIDESQRTQAQTLDKLASFNGSLKHVENGLRDTVTGLQALMAVIAELHALPQKPPTT